MGKESAETKNIKRYHPAPDEGLSPALVQQRMIEGLNNVDCTVATRSVGRIVRDNVCTLFNLINVILAAAVLAVGSYKNCLFMGVVLCNLAIGIFQELRAKRTVDKLSLLSSVKAHVIRSGMPVEIPVDGVVLDDVLALKSGGQVVTDCVVLSGECEVNESFVTGESEPILKHPGDLLLAGSFVVSGECKARAEHVGDENYISTISKGAKQFKKVRSEIMETLKKIIRFVSVIIIPVGGLLFWGQMRLPDNSFNDAVVQTVAALIGMIPEGLMLLTSTVLAVSVIRLSSHKVLVQELYCIEALARVDTLCLDKTGTLTEGTMEVSKVISWGNYPVREAEEALRALCRALPDRNATFEAIAKKYGEKSDWKLTKAVPFSSKTKWSGASFEGKGTYVIGAGEFLFPEMAAGLKSELDRYAKEGRVLLLARSESGFRERGLPEGLKPVAFVLIQDVIRPEAEETLRYFMEQGVDVKVISGDNPLTVSQIAKRTGLKNWDQWVDLSACKTDEEVKAAAARYTVFGRVLPDQKKLLIKALKEAGHTVAMTGDGINDVLALKEADCSIAMASGSDAARNVSQLVLLNSNFDSMPRVVGEGRRSINNIQRSASLFLTKTMYATMLALLFLFIQMPYPFMPIQLTLISAVTIGIPAFILALEPNRARIEGNFLRNILMKAVPGGVTIVMNIVLTVFIGWKLDFPVEMISTICVLLTGFAGLLLILRLCMPFTLIRKILLGFLCALFAGCVVFLPGLFSLVPLSGAGWALTGGLALLAAVVLNLLIWGMGKRFGKGRSVGK